MEIENRVIAAQSIEVIRLPWIEGLSQIQLNAEENLILSTKVEHGAYQVQTNLNTVRAQNQINSIQSL